jgi:hypothetical protein
MHQIVHAHSVTSRKNVAKCGATTLQMQDSCRVASRGSARAAKSLSGRPACPEFIGLQARLRLYRAPMLAP